MRVMLRSLLLLPTTFAVFSAWYSCRGQDTAPPESSEQPQQVCSSTARSRTELHQILHQIVRHRGSKYSCALLSTPFKTHVLRPSYPGC
jgi:hypothetical protein